MKVEVGDQLPELRKHMVIQLMRSRTWSGLNPIHWDPEYAAEHGLPAPAANGMIPAAYLSEMCAIYFGEALMHDTWIQFKFLRPVHPDDVITTSGMVESMTEENGKTIVHANLWAKNQNGDVVTAGTVDCPVDLTDG